MGLVNKGRWKEDKTYLEENYGTISIKEIAKKLEKSEKSIMKMVYKLKLKDLYHSWSDEEIKILKKYYPLEGKKVASRLPYKTEKQCLDKAIRLKIKSIGSKTSKYKYVSWNEKDKRWQVTFHINCKNKYFGSFKDEDEAGRVAMEKAKEYGKAI